MHFCATEVKNYKINILKWKYIVRMFRQTFDCRRDDDRGTLFCPLVKDI